MQRASLLAFATILACLLAPSRGSAQSDDDWKPGPANDPATCSELWEAIGLPEYTDTSRKRAGNKDAESATTIVCHTRYVLSHNNANKTPDWVLERVPKSQISGGNKRPKIKFQSDEALPPSAQAKDKDYVGSKFDRGHQAPSDDFNAEAEWMEESFLLSNIVPQQGKGFNQHIWRNLEDLVRDVIRQRGELYIITGPVNPDEDGGGVSIKANANACGNAITLKPLKRAAICGKAMKCDDDGVTVPMAMFKILYDPKLKRMNAYIMPNIDHRPDMNGADAVSYLKKFRAPVSVVEQWTGIRFFPDLSKRDRKVQVEKCGATMLH